MSVNRYNVQVVEDPAGSLTDYHHLEAAWRERDQAVKAKEVALQEKADAEQALAEANKRIAEVEEQLASAVSS